MNEIANDILSAPVDSPVILVLSLLYATYESIRVYDARLLQVKTMGLKSAVAIEAHGRTLPRWVGYIHLVGIMLIIVLLILNWKYAIALYALLLLLRVVPVLERIGAIIMSPFLGEQPCKEPEDTETPRRLAPEEIEERERKTEFIKSHREMVTKAAAEYMVEHPDESLEDVVDFVTEKCFREHEIARIEAEIEATKAEVEATIAGFSKGKSPPRPLGKLTYDEASFYCTKYFKLMEEGVGPRAKESRLPTTLERMQEALKVECLRWCDRGDDFDESCKFFATGYVMLGVLAATVKNLAAG